MIREDGSREIIAKRVLNRFHQPLNLVDGQRRKIVVVSDVVDASTIPAVLRSTQRSRILLFAKRLPMNLTPELHRIWVSNFFKGKIEEFGFHLRWIVRCCDESIETLRMGLNQPESAHAEVPFAFSSFSNAVQTLKDAGSTFLDPKITWTDIGQLRHGEFMRMSRNAATHDGNPMISAWADGHFYVPAEIRRFDNRGALIQIPAPEQDVRTFCLEFALDFSEYLSSKLGPFEHVEGPKLDLSHVEKGLQSPFVPDFARKLLKENRSHIEQALQEAKVYPAKEAIGALNEMRSFCIAQLETSPS